MKLNVIRQRGIWWSLSLGLIAIGLVAMLLSWQNPNIRAPLKPSIDFVGGTRLELSLDCTKPDNCKPIEVGKVRDLLSQQGLGNSTVQLLDKDQTTVSIRTIPLSEEVRSKLQKTLGEQLGSFDASKTKIDTVGPVIGQQILGAGLKALLVSFVLITIYMTVRFQLDYAIFGIVALFHDVLVTTGIFALLGLVMGVEVDSLFLVSLLTIVGFSINDTVVIYDRIRETLEQNPSAPINDIVDAAVNQTLGRSINTTLTTLLTLTAIFLFGGETLRIFALSLIIGFVLGAYSSIFIASTLLAWWRNRAENSPSLVKAEEA
jgi:preprotein translocase subunit SecF